MMTGTRPPLCLLPGLAVRQRETAPQSDLCGDFKESSIRRDCLTELGSEEARLRSRPVHRSIVRPLHADRNGTRDSMDFDVVEAEVRSHAAYNEGTPWPPKLGEPIFGYARRRITSRKASSHVNNLAPAVEPSDLKAKVVFGRQRFDAELCDELFSDARKSSWRSGHAVAGCDSVLHALGQGKVVHSSRRISTRQSALANLCWKALPRSRRSMPLAVILDPPSAHRGDRKVSPSLQSSPRPQARLVMGPPKPYGGAPPGLPRRIAHRLRSRARSAA